MADPETWLALVEFFEWVNMLDFYLQSRTRTLYLVLLGPGVLNVIQVPVIHMAHLRKGLSRWTTMTVTVCRLKYVNS